MNPSSSMESQSLTHAPLERRLSGLRVLYCADGELFGARGTQIVSSRDGGLTWKPRAQLVLPLFLDFASRVRILARLGRTEIYKMQVQGDRIVALARGGVYTGSFTEGRVTLSFRVREGSRPISLAWGPDGTVYFGEYASNPERGPVKIYASHDLKNWRVAHEFPAGEIRHVHGIFWDSYSECFWILTGDFGDEAGFLKASPDFSDVAWVRRGSQSVRAYTVLMRPEGLIFATDTEVESNAIYRMSRDGKELEKLHSLESSSFHAQEFGEWAVFSTVCEPSVVNETRQLHIWASRDFKKWIRLATFQKDGWPFVFQFGNIFFPEGNLKSWPEFVFSGTALQGLDDESLFLPLSVMESSS